MCPRVCVFQYRLERYRIPFFQLLAQECQLSVIVETRTPRWFDASAANFAVLESPSRALTPAGRAGFKWQRAHLDLGRMSAYDCVIVPWDIGYVSLFVASLWKWGRGQTKVLVWGHGYSRNESTVRRVLREFLGNRASGAVFYMATQRNAARKRGQLRSPLFVAPNAIPLEAVRKARIEWEGSGHALSRWQAANGIDPSNTIIFVSRITKKARLRILLSAIHLMRKNNEHVRCILVGDGEERLVSERFSDECGLRDHVWFVGELHDEAKLAPLMLSSTVFCYPGDIGLSAHHAFAYSLPVVTHDKIEKHCPEIELVVPGETGLLFKYDDPESLACELTRLLRDPARVEAMGEKANQSLEENYTMVRMASGMRDAIHAVLDR